MMVPLEIVRGRPESAPAIVKHAVRFGRRLRKHGVRGIFPFMLSAEALTCKVAVGKRTVNIFNDGSHTASLRTAHGTHDSLAFVAQRQRMHAIYLTMAKESRQRGNKDRARFNIYMANLERRHERTNAI